MNTTKAKEFFKKLSDKFLDLLYPEGLTCVNCGDELQHETRRITATTAPALINTSI